MNKCGVGLTTNEKLQAGGRLMRLINPHMTPSVVFPTIARGEWEHLLLMAQHSKTLGLVKLSLNRQSLDAPEEVSAKLASFETAAVANNFRNLAATTKAFEVLETAGLQPICFKGPLRTFQVYDTWTARNSSDVDLLVAEKNYRPAIAALCADGYELKVPEESIWWHEDLGEAPFMDTRGLNMFVDLHHAVQQPGGPFPKHLGDFFDASVITSFGTSHLRTLAPHDCLLICAISFGKALRTGDAWLLHAHEFATVVRAFDKDEYAGFLERAKRQGLRRLCAHLAACADSLFPFPENNGAARSDRIDDDVLDSALGMQRHRPLNMTRSLWEWTDGRNATRIGEFGSGLLRVVRAKSHARREN